MNVRQDLHVVGWLVALLGAVQVVPLMAAFLYLEAPGPYLGSAGLALGCGGLLALATRVPALRLRLRDGFLVVGLGWIVICVFGALPYVLTGAVGPVDALFESISGFTTTGATVLRAQLASLPRPLLLWRAMTQWIGGAGVVVFGIAVLPVLGIGGMHLFMHALPGHVPDKIQPRVGRTIRLLWVVYVGFTVVAGLALAIGGLPPFEAICHAFATVATGGFSTRADSIAAFASPRLEWVVTGLMALAGTSLLVQWRLVGGRLRGLGRDGELRYYGSAAAVAGAVVVLALLVDGGLPGGTAVRGGVFQAMSFLSGTGYASTDFGPWPPLAHLVLVVLMVLGGMTGSTGGGVRSLRALLGVRALRQAMARLPHARAISVLKYAGEPVDEPTLDGLWAFFGAYALTVSVAALAVAAGGHDVTTAWSAALSAVGNVGPGLGEVGAFADFAVFGPVLKGVLAVAMLAGRLELFTLFVLIAPPFWRR